MLRLRKFISQHKTLLLSVGFLTVFSFAVTYATPPGSPYGAGATLDPACAPGSSNCTVTISGGGSQWTTVTGGINYSGGKVGIGASTPATALDIEGDGAILAVGTQSAGVTVPNLGAGTRLMWIPSKAAFRAGPVTGTDWDNANVGAGSVAFADGIASGTQSFAMAAATASGAYSFAFDGGIASGNDSVAFASTATGVASAAFNGGVASGIQSVAFNGNNSLASGVSSAAFNFSTAAGRYSSAFGFGNTADSYSSFALGRYNVGGGNATTWVGTDPLFEIGNGAGTGARADALLILKNGNTTINGDLNVTGNVTCGSGCGGGGGGSQWQGASPGLLTYSGSGIQVGANTQSVLGITPNTAFASARDVALGEQDFNEIWIEATDSGTGAAGDFDTYGSSTSWDTYQSATDGGANTSSFDVTTTPTTVAFTLSAPNNGNVQLIPTTADGSAGFFFQTSVAHTTGNILELWNNTTNLFTVNYAGKIGVNTATPTAELDLEGDGAIYAQGVFGVGNGIAVPDVGSNHTTRLEWIPSASAFRAGTTWHGEWDSGNVGQYSTAFGWDTKASGQYSTATGQASIASGSAAFSGNSGIASGTNATAFGAGTASGAASLAGGNHTTASGDQSTSFGIFTQATSVGELAIGQYNVGGGDPNIWQDTDPVFEIGNGQDQFTTSDALMVLKNGATGIGLSPGSSPTFLLQVGSGGIDGIVARFESDNGTCDINPTSAALSCSSDMTLKKNIVNLADNSSWSFNNNITPANQTIFAKVLALNPVDYNWKTEADGTEQHDGFIAQEVQQVFPNLVSQDPKTHLLSLNYIGLIPYTVEAVKEMNLNITNIDDLTKSNTWRDALSNWFADSANGIKSLVVHNQICVDDQCLTKDDIRQLLQIEKNNGGTSPTTTTTSSGTSNDSSDTSDQNQSPEVQPQSPEVQPSTPVADTPPVSTQSPEN
ncbi:MAG TPA: tail fiber domain-containing protein [Candidatus Paceibacterota bacterium]|jgi:hypothetical protein|nr:tail fiber domain-containing protein [Candidatus Paceibacterota bacterium]